LKLEELQHNFSGTSQNLSKELEYNNRNNFGHRGLINIKGSKILYFYTS